MINFVLKIGSIVNDKFNNRDDYELTLTAAKNYDSDSIYSILNAYTNPKCTRAELRMFIEGDYELSHLIVSFKRIKLKNKGYR